MKKITISVLAASALFCVGCQNENLQTKIKDNDYRLTINLSDESRTYIEGLQTKWNKGDQVYVSSADGSVEGILNLQSMSTDGKTAIFGGDINGDVDKLAYAVTPVPVNNVIDLTRRSAEQCNPILFGRFGSDKSEIGFTPQNAIMRIRLNNVPDNATLKIKGEKIAGTATVNASGVSYSKSNTMTISQIKSAPTQVIDIPLLANTGLDLSISINGGTAYTLNNITVVDGKIKENGIPTLKYTTGGLVKVTANQVTGGSEAISKDADGNYYVETEEESPVKLEEALSDLNASSEQKETATVNLIGETNVTWTTGAGHGSTPLITEENNITKELIIDGNNTATLEAVGDGVGSIRHANGGKLVFKNLNIVDNSVSYAENAWEFTYLEFSGDLEFVNCTFQSGISIDSDNGSSPNVSAKFTDCTFVSPNANEYSVWVGHGTIEFENCTFQGTRGLKMHEAYGSDLTSVKVNNCIFNNLTKKPGIAIGDLNATTIVSITNSQFINCQAGDQGLYMYETDTDVSTFNFTENNNTIK